MNLPKISIITPSYNQGQYLEKTISSVISQDYPNLEYIIIDGGSSDNSVEIIKKYESNLAYWVSEKDTGQSNALNKGFGKISGDIVGWINSDDWYDVNVFNEVACIFNTKNIQAVIGNCTLIYEDRPSGLLIDKPGTVKFNRLLRYWEDFFCPPQPSIFFSHELLRKVGFLDESLHYAMDLDLWLRMAAQTDFHYIDKNLSYYLIHSSSKSGSGDGFKKFIPEWKSVCMKYIEKAGPLQKMQFYMDYWKNKISERF